MATGTRGTQSREYHTHQLHYLRKDLVETSAAAGSVGVLPAGAVIIPVISGVYVNTLFSGGNPAVDVGIAGSATLYASALDLDAALGFVVLDEVSADSMRVTVDTEVLYALTLDTPTGGAAGHASIIIFYTIQDGV